MAVFEQRSVSVHEVRAQRSAENCYFQQGLVETTPEKAPVVELVDALDSKLCKFAKRGTVGRKNILDNKCLERA